MAMSTDQRYRADLVRRVADRLSLPRERVENMVVRSEQLQRICDEYETCRTAARRWRAIETTGHSRLEEFVNLSDDLEAEVVRWLADHMDDSARNTSR
jgi:hypothetical protein